MPSTTDTKLKALKPRNTRYTEWIPGTPGLGLRVNPSGTKSWIYCYRVGKQVKWETLGQYPDDLSLADARSEAGQRTQARKVLMREARNRRVPYEEVQREIWATEAREAEQQAKVRRAALEADTVADLARIFIARHAKPHLKSWSELERVLERTIVARYGPLLAKDITRRNIIELLDEMAERGTYHMANRTKAAISSMYSYAIEKEVVEQSPCVGIRQYKERSRDRVLDEEEIRAFWETVDDIVALPGVRIALKLLLLTGQRRGELVGARWLEFSDSGWWEIPSERTKNGRTHRVWITTRDR